MERPERKPNRLQDYDYSQNGAYFVTICTQERRRILSYIVGDGFPVPKPTGIIAEKYVLQIPKKYPSVSIDRYIIMPDHIHILLRLDGGTGDPSPTIGTVIGWYKYQVTKEYHLKINTAEEKLFQRSYYDHIIRNQRDYDEIWEYIENNPLKWALENKNAAR
ncbi:MAG: transposase [Oscillospiraceae bacterium]|nr:transposase [Oscillospiraceae bacterium]